jgi:DNA gyrase/topoisomerase IV subunit A
MDRALPDVRDGLKPVQRRILDTMWEERMVSTKAPKKSVNVVGRCLATRHPHSDAAVYQTMVAMVNQRYPLLDGHGNFGKYGRPAAAYRYTEVRFSKLGQTIFDDYNIAPMVPNFSGDLKEALLLPTKLPLHLLNGTEGIGVGIAGCIPPHNLEELTKTLAYLLKNPECKDSQLYRYLKGPDYGYGVLLSTPEEVATVYNDGEGSLQFRCKYEIKDDKKNKCQVFTVTDLCPGFNIETFMERCNKLKDDGFVLYVSDRTSKEGLRLEVGFKDMLVFNSKLLPLITKTESYRFWAVRRTSDPDQTLNAKTLQRYNMRGLLQEFLNFRHIVEKKALKFKKAVLEKDLLKQEAFLVAQSKLDVVYQVLKVVYPDRASMQADLAQRLGLTDEQAGFILDAMVSTLAKLNAATQQQKVADLKAKVEEVDALLADIPGVVLTTLKSMVSFKDERKTVIQNAGQDADTPDIKAETQYLHFRKGEIFRDTQVDLKARIPYDRILPVVPDMKDSTRNTVGYLNKTTGLLHFKWYAQFVEESTKADIGGVMAGTDEYLLALNVKHQAILCEVGKNVGEAHVMKTDQPLKSLIGFSSTDQVLLLDRHNNGFLYTVPELLQLIKVQRRNTRPHKLTNGLKLSKIMKVGKNEELWTLSGEQVVRAADGAVVLSGPAEKPVAISRGNNYVQKQGAKPEILSYADTVAGLQSGEIVHVLSLG